MKKSRNLQVIFILWTILCVYFPANAERTHEMMYEPISGASCFRRLNGTHQTGCSSSSSGSVGALHVVKTIEDINFLLNNPPSPPYAPVIPPPFFTRTNLLRLKNEGGKNISVVILVNRTDNMTQFSHELTCPNQYSNINNFTCDATRPETLWNPFGTGLLHEDFPFPIYYVADPDEKKKILDCFEKFNNFDYDTQATRSLCSVQVNTFMSAAVSSEVCIRRTNFVNNLSRTRYCDPLEGRNIYATLFPRNQTDEKREVDKEEKLIMVTTRLDTTSMFDGVGLGAMDSLLSYATLVNVAHMLARLLPQHKNEKYNILFVVFNGETYDYIGSQRFVYDIQNKAFPTRSTRTNPIDFDNIALMIDIGALDEMNEINLHSRQNIQLASEFLGKVRNYSTEYDLKVKFNSVLSENLPPTSAQSFLRANLSFPAVILNSKPANKFYHSIYDDQYNIGFSYGNTTMDFSVLMENELARDHFQVDSVQMKIRNVSSALALGLYEILTGVVYYDNKLANPILVDEFLFCFLQMADCPLFKAASHPNSQIRLPIPPLRYISVQGASQEASGWSYRLLGYILSQKITEINKENCTYLPLHWFAGYDGKGECRMTTQNYSVAMSPAFLIDDYDWKSGQYSTWTESTWSQLSARIFLRPSKTHETITLSIGIVVAILSFCIVYLINSRSEVLFEDAPSRSSITEPAAC
ncbi:nicastrin isoform X2 [Episyrphus balteatus]|uniref:nicastrin isoform X2 n=1 Tax=Episyrphus balteatus TaxID=286459 RepID=UPI002485A03E|nr:nicastrin isoform X2 [Episyrphus balteatus]